MNDQEDQFFIEPEVEQVQDIKPIREPEIIDKGPPLFKNQSIFRSSSSISTQNDIDTKARNKLLLQAVSLLGTPTSTQHSQSSQSEEDQARIDSQSPFTNITGGIEWFISVIKMNNINASIQRLIFQGIFASQHFP